MPMKYQPNSKGLTLVELMITIFLMASILTVTTLVVSQTVKYFHSMTVRSQLQQEAERSLNTIIRSMQQGRASSVSICSCGGAACSDTCSVPANFPPNSRVEFTPVGSASATSFYWSNKMIYLQSGGNAPTQVASNVTGL